jgi:hypothetical protein
VIEYHLQKRISAWVTVADASSGIGSLVYLQLSGQLAVWLALLCLLAVLVCARWFTVPVAAGAASVLYGGMVLIAGQIYASNTVLLAWCALLAVASVRSVAQTVIPWLQRRAGL